MSRGTAKPLRIMRAVERLFKSRRVHEITLDAVARAAGVGKGTIYVHFRDKDDLFFRTATAGFDDLCTTLSGSVPQLASFPDQLLAACTAIDAFFSSSCA
jgi:AcrR family transcriptional regulator